MVQVTVVVGGANSSAAEGTGLEPAIRLLMFSHSHSSESSS